MHDLLTEMNQNNSILFALTSLFVCILAHKLGIYLLLEIYQNELVLSK